MKYEQEKENLKKNMTVKLKEKKQAMTMRLQKKEQQETSKLVTEHSQQMLDLLQQKQTELRQELMVSVNKLSAVYMYMNIKVLHSRILKCILYTKDVCQMYDEQEHLENL